MFELPGLIDQLWVIPLAGLLGGFLAGLIGVGGGILVTPLLITVGLPARYVAGTMPMVVITNALSTLYHLRLKEKLDLKLGGLLGIGGAVGGLLGALLIRQLELTTDIDQVIQLMFVFLLLLAMLRLLLGSPASGGGRLVSLARIPLLRVRSELTEEPVSLLPLLPAGMLIGAVAVMMGVGGAILLTPLLVMLMNLDIKQASSLAVVYLLVTAAANAVNHALITHNSNILLGLLLMPAGALGVFFGVEVRYRLQVRGLTLLFALVLFSAAVSMAWKSWHHQAVTPGPGVEEPVLLLPPLVTALLSLVFPLVISALVIYLKILLQRLRILSSNSSS